MNNSTQSKRLIERIRWLIRLRWFAVAGLLSVIVFVQFLLRLQLNFSYLYFLTFILGFYNLIFYSIKLPSFSLTNKIANLQISLDLFVLAILIHFSGGVENPFVFYFIFHMIIASILLSRRASFLQATFAVVLFSSMVVLEYLDIIPHYCLEGFSAYTPHYNLLNILGVFFVFSSTVYIAVYMATSITKRLRRQEKDLESANELLKEKDRIKSEYVLRVTHDIKEHLSAIQGCLQPVVKEITGSLNDKQKDLLKRADNRSYKLAFFVKALLEITRIKLTKQIAMEEFFLAEILNYISDDIAARARSKNITFKADIDSKIGKIKGVRVYIEETIANLLANSIKYTPSAGAITLTAKDMPNKISIQIKDTGIGIPKEELPHIFEEFYRASNAKEIEKQGTGLGLAMAKEVVENMHKGKIWVESEENKGSIFFLDLPK